MCQNMNLLIIIQFSSLFLHVNWIATGAILQNQNNQRNNKEKKIIRTNRRDI
jgi:hypothetical protein